MGVANHLKQRQIRLSVVDCPARIEHLVPAVFRICLGKHHELYISRFSSKRRKGTHKVVDLTIRERQAQFNIRRRQIIKRYARQLPDWPSCKNGIKLLFSTGGFGHTVE